MIFEYSNFFGKKNITILFCEDLMNDTTSYTEKVCDTLELGDKSKEDMTNYLNNKFKNIKQKLDKGKLKSKQVNNIFGDIMLVANNFLKYFEGN